MKYKQIFFWLLLIGLGAVVFSFQFAKSTLASFTHDESLTYLNYVHTSFMDILSYKGSYTNNHLLNSMFMKYSEMLFGTSEIALRLPNLLLLVIFMVYSALILKRLNRLVALGFFLILITNSELIELFGMARGYGMSCGFMVMALYHLIASWYGHRTRHRIFFHIGALLAALSSFTLLTFYVSLLVVDNVIALIYSEKLPERKYNPFKFNLVHFIALLPVVAILYEPIRRVLSFNKLDFGGKNGFYGDTITELIYYCFHHMYVPQSTVVVLQIVITAVVVSGVLLGVLKARKERPKDSKGNLELVVSSVLLITIAIVIIAQHLILGSDYPIARFSIFIYPLFIIQLAFWCNRLADYISLKIILPVTILAAVISATNFFMDFDFYSCSEWGYDQSTKAMVQRLVQYHQSHDSEPAKVKVGINWFFEPTINFYRTTMDIDWLLPADRNGLSATDDFYYIIKDDLGKLDTLNYKVVADFDKSNTILLKNNTKY